MQYNEYKEFISIEGLRKQVAISTMTRKEICEKAGITEETLAPLLLRSRTQLTTTENIARLAYALECRIDDLVEFKGIKYDERYSMYSRLPKEPEAGLSYQPLWSMMFNEYGPGYKNKFESLFENVQSVSIKKIESDSYDSRSYKRKLNGNYPLTLPAIYEICRTFKCTPGCIFGCKGDYDWEEKNSVYSEYKNTILFRGDKIKKINIIDEINHLNSNVYISKELDTYHIIDGSSKKHTAEIGNVVIYSDTKEELMYESISNSATVYEIESINYELEKKFFVNGDWRKYVRVIAKNKNDLICKNSYYYLRDKRRKAYPYNNGLILVFNGYITDIPLEGKESEITDIDVELKNLVSSYKNKGVVQMYSDFYERNELVFNPNFNEPIKKYLP